MPATGVEPMPHSAILSFEEIFDVVKYGVSLGINKVRITGGEPLVRKDITSLVKMLSELDGITDLAMTTNGILLEQFARSLVKAGLLRINISLDTTDPDRFREITHGGDISQVFQGIEAALSVGLKPLKINCVIRKDVNEPDAAAVAEWCSQRNLEVRFIHLMDLHSGSFTKVIGGEGGNCRICNRMRLTANGKLKPCLFNDIEYDIRTLGITEAWKEALSHKPACGTINTTGEFYNIGG